MRFEYPRFLWLLLLALPAALAFFWWAWRTRQRLIAQFVQSRLLANLTVGVSPGRQKIRVTLLVAALALVIVVLARPQWGFSYEEARQKGLDIVVAIDTSRSMLAPDVPPNRLARAKLAALDLKRLARTDRVGLVAFAGGAFLQCPLSFDDEAFRQSVEALDVNIIPQGGTALAEAIDTARAAFKEKTDNYNALILFSDGEDHDGRAVEAARAAAKEGMRIYTVGVGTPNGELLRITDGKGRSDYVRDQQGNVVKSRLNEQLLRDAAKAADGFYMLLTGANTIDLLYERGLAPLPKTEQSARQIKRFHERFQIFLSVVILLLIAEMFLPERKRVQRSAAAGEQRLARAAALLVLLCLPQLAFASSSSALRKYRAGNYESAQWEYERLLKKKPDDPRLHFNAGAAAFRREEHETAAKHFNSALLTPDLELQQRSYYNLGNAQFRLGEDATEPQAKSEQWQGAVSSYESALKLNPTDADARHNLELVKKKLEELKQQQQQQQNQDNKENKEDEKKDQQQKDEQQKQEEQKKEDQQKQEQQKQQESEQQKKEQQQQQKPEEKQEQKPQEQQQQQGEKGEKPEDEKQAAQMARAIPMTQQEAERLLDSLKAEQKAMIFIPQVRTNRPDRVFKDW